MFEVDLVNDIHGTCRRFLLNLESNCPMDLHLTINDTPDKPVRSIINSLDNKGYVIVVNSKTYGEIIQSALQIPDYHIQSVIEAKYMPAYLPAATDLIVWDLWSIHQDLTLKLLRQEWKHAHVFARNIGFSSRKPI